MPGLDPGIHVFLRIEQREFLLDSVHLGIAGIPICIAKWHADKVAIAAALT
jgi:hypothetical protein